MMFMAVIVLITLALLFRLQAKQWTAPGSFFAGYWAIWVTFALVFSPKGYPVTTEAVWWIILFVFSLGAGAALAKPLAHRVVDKKRVEQITHEKFTNLSHIVVLLSLAGIIGAFILVISMGKGVFFFFSLSALKSMAASVSESRYSGGYQPPILYTLSTCFSYAACYLGGLLWTIQKRKVAFLPFLPVILSSAIMTTKAGLLFQVFMWIAGWLAGRIQLGNTKISGKIIFRLFFTAALLTGTFILTSMLRYKIYTLQAAGIIYEKLTVYFVGFLSGFSQWLSSQNFRIYELGLGKYTLAGLYDVVGFSQRSQGIINETVIVGRFSTNIFTLFRYIIQDVGFVGSIIVMVFIGFLFSIVYEFTKRGSLFAMSLLMLFYAQVLFSNTTSIFGYNTMIVAWIITAFYCSQKSLTWKRGSRIQMATIYREN